MIYLRLFWEFFKAGLFAVGGGLATLPFLTAISDSTGWYTKAQLADMVAVSESTPGPVGVNMATYVGFTIRGVPGSLVATIGLITPSVIVILIVAKILDKFRSNKYVDRAFYAIRPSSTALITSALIGLMMLCFFNVDAYRASGALTDLFSLKNTVLFAALYVFTNYVKQTNKLHPIVFIAVSAVAGIAFSFAGA